jgi:hypothetical protein
MNSKNGIFSMDVIVDFISDEDIHWPIDYQSNRWKVKEKHEISWECEEDTAT